METDKEIKMPEDYANTELNRMIVIEAFKSLDIGAIKTEDELARQLTKRALTLSKVTSANSVEMRSLAALRIYGTVNSMEWEESSQRWVVKFTERKEGAEEEMLRSPRMDTFDGRILKPYLDKLKAKVDEGGDKPRARFYKFNEMPAEGAKGKNVPSKGYRTFCWIEVY